MFAFTEKRQTEMRIVMRDRVKRYVCLLLALMFFAGLLPVQASAKETTVEERQKQAVAAALAYFDKGHSVQYGGKAINDYIHRYDGGKTRSTNNASPEYATPNETMYTVCSDFAHQVYWEAFRFDLLGKGAGYVWTNTLSGVREPEPVDPSDPDYPNYLIKKRNAGMLVWSYDPYSTAGSPTAEINEMYALAQPGDVFTAYGMRKENGVLVGIGGHTMIWAGDVTGDGRPDIIHSGGRHMNIEKQIDKREYFSEEDPDYIRDRDYYSWVDPIDFRDNYANFGSSTNGGSIRIADAQDYINERYVKRSCRMSLLRPALVMTDETYPVRAASQYRAEHPGLTIDRTLSKTRFNSAFPGETVTMTLKLTNNSARHAGFISGSDDPDFDDGDSEGTETTLQNTGASATVLAAAHTKAALQSKGESYTVTVTETVPEGAKLKTPFAGAKVTGETMTLNVPLAPGETRTLTAEFEVTAALGETVTFDGGFVGDIPSNTIPIRVGGRKLTAADTAKLAQVADGKYNALLSKEAPDNDTLADFVYGKILGVRLQLPRFTQIAKLTKSVHTESGKMTYVFRSENEIAAENLTAYNMLVKTCWGGKYIWNQFGHERCSDPRDMHLEPGDVVVRSNDLVSTAGNKKCEQLLYLGNGKYLTCDEETGSYPIVHEQEFFRCLFSQIFYVLRPTLVRGELPGRAEVTVEGTGFKPGKSGAVTLRLDHNVGIAGATLKLHYDPALKPEKLELGDALAGLQFTQPNLSENPISLHWEGDAADSSCGTLLTITFSAPEKTKNGEYAVTLSHEPGEVYDGSAEAVTLLIENGSVTVQRLPVGDVNDDGVIGAKDVTALRRYLAGGYGIAASETVADANGDGAINAKDLTLLRRYLAGGYGVELNRPENQLKPDETPRIPLP